MPYQDPIAELLEKKGLPLTLENWLAYAFTGTPPENWWQEIEVPPSLQGELEAYLEGDPPLAPEQYAEHLLGEELSEGDRSKPLARPDPMPEDRMIDLFLQDERSMEEKVRNPFPRKSSGS